MDVSPVPPLTVQTETFSVPGVETSWELHVGAPEMPAGIFLLGPIRVPTRGTIEIPFYNGTAGVIYPGVQLVRIIAF